MENLLSPQWIVDLDHVAELSAHLSAASGEQDLLDFCCGPAESFDPALVGLNGLVASSRRRDLAPPEPLEIRRLGPAHFRVSFDLRARPNYVWVGVIQENGQAIVLNGVHRVAAAIEAGLDRTYAVISLISVNGGLINFGDPSILKANRILAPRPALVRDFLAKEVQDDVDQRAFDQYLKVAVQTELGIVPRLDD